MSRQSTRVRGFTFPENRAAVLAFQDLGKALCAGKTYQGPSHYYLYGPTGTGKTHLVQALVNDLPPTRKAVQISAADFQLAPSFAGKTEDTLGPLIERAVDADLWVVEDLQHLPVAAAEILVQILDRRATHGTPTVLTAPTGPQQLKHRGERFPSRLTSRLAAGLVVRLDPWQASSRLEFLRERAQCRQLAVASEILQWLAHHLAGGGRPLEGAIEQLTALNKINHPLTLATVQAHFQTQVEAGKPTLPRIASQVGRYFALDPAQLQSPRRSPSILWPRQVGMFLARQLTGQSLAKIGRFFGGRDHSTVLHACRKVEGILAADPVRSGAVRSLQAELT